MIGIIIGGKMTGILGMLLAAPVLATLRVVGSYIFSRLYDRDPFAELEEEAEPPKPGWVQRACVAAWRQLQEQVELRKEQRTEQDVENPGPISKGDEPANS